MDAAEGEKRKKRKWVFSWSCVKAPVYIYNPIKVGLFLICWNWLMFSLEFSSIENMLCSFYHFTDWLLCSENHVVFPWEQMSFCVLTVTTDNKRRTPTQASYSYKEIQVVLFWRCNARLKLVKHIYLFIKRDPVSRLNSFEFGCLLLTMLLHCLYLTVGRPASVGLSSPYEKKKELLWLRK